VLIVDVRLHLKRLRADEIALVASDQPPRFAVGGTAIAAVGLSTPLFLHAPLISEHLFFVDGSASLQSQKLFRALTSTIETERERDNLRQIEEQRRRRRRRRRHRLKQFCAI